MSERPNIFPTHIALEEKPGQRSRDIANFLLGFTIIVVIIRAGIAAWQAWPHSVEVIAACAFAGACSWAAAMVVFEEKGETGNGR